MSWNKWNPILVIDPPEPSSLSYTTKGFFIFFNVGKYNQIHIDQQNGLNSKLINEINAMIRKMQSDGLNFKHFFIPLKEEIGCFQNLEIQLNTNNILRPCGTISGNFVFTAKSEIICYGIRIQLDAIVNLSFIIKTKSDNVTRSHEKKESLLEGALEMDKNFYIKSPCMEQLSEPEDSYVEDDPTKSTMTLKPGTHTFPFTLKMPAGSLPPPFKSQYGNLQYKIGAYMKSACCYVQVEEKPLRFKGYNCLADNPSLSKEVQHESGFKKSLFASKRDLTSTLSLEKAGFLPGEDVTFRITISNPKYFKVEKLVVYLTRTVSYNTNKANRTIKANLDTFEIKEMRKDEDIIFIGKLSIPKNSIPSYKAKQIYSIVHLIRYELKVEEFNGSIKGQIEITIGTTKEPIVDSLAANNMSYLQVDDNIEGGLGRFERSGSVSSTTSDSSGIVSSSMLPPCYSRLSLSPRTISMLSLETLPPHYDDLF